VALGPTVPAIEWARGFFHGEKWPGCDCDHSYLSSTKVKNELSYTSAPLMCLRGVHRDSFTVA
jgi:hypothetical protein